MYYKTPSQNDLIMCIKELRGVSGYQTSNERVIDSAMKTGRLSRLLYEVYTGRKSVGDLNERDIRILRDVLDVVIKILKK